MFPISYKKDIYLVFFLIFVINLRFFPFLLFSSKQQLEYTKKKN